MMLKIQRKIRSGSYGDPSVITPSSQNSDACHAGADNDVAGSLVFKTNDAAQNNQDFAKVIAAAEAAA